ncbi:MAG: phosphate propanoyltransferase [Candidatus Eisenbacteria bacterium]|nr:phosphate propanoyltransferase [Candidatus Eisenbacteria bacterium]
MDDVEKLASEVIRRLRGEDRNAGEPSGDIPVAVSVRHIHVSRGVLDRLFGEGFQLTRLRDLRQPGEFASEQTVTAVGRSMKAIECVRVLGPLRPYTQLELSGTDAVRLGLNPPVRESGNLVGSEPVTLVGPMGAVQLKEGAIMATRHIHMTERDAGQYGVRNGDRVRIRFAGDRALVLENVLIRVAKNAALEFHIDTDDANAAGVRLPMTVRIHG